MHTCGEPLCLPPPVRRGSESLPTLHCGARAGGTPSFTSDCINSPGRKVTRDPLAEVPQPRLGPEVGEKGGGIPPAVTSNPPPQWEPSALALTEGLRALGVNLWSGVLGGLSDPPACMVSGEPTPEGCTGALQQAFPSPCKGSFFFPSLPTLDTTQAGGGAPLNPQHPQFSLPHQGSTSQRPHPPSLGLSHQAWQFTPSPGLCLQPT